VRPERGADNLAAICELKGEVDKRSLAAYTLLLEAKPRGVEGFYWDANFPHGC
jgi:hypothetical protein